VQPTPLLDDIYLTISFTELETLLLAGHSSVHHLDEDSEALDSMGDESTASRISKRKPTSTSHVSTPRKKPRKTQQEGKGKGKAVLREASDPSGPDHTETTENDVVSSSWRRTSEEDGNDGNNTGAPGSSMDVDGEQEFSSLLRC
jgi:hypothetical protein